MTDDNVINLEEQRKVRGVAPNGAGDGGPCTLGEFLERVDEIEPEIIITISTTTGSVSVWMKDGAEIITLSQRRWLQRRLSDATIEILTTSKEKNQ